MPTIDIKKKDLDTLIGKKLSLEALEKKLMLAKAELKEYNAATDVCRPCTRRTSIRTHTTHTPRTPNTRAHC